MPQIARANNPRALSGEPSVAWRRGIATSTLALIALVGGCSASPSADLAPSTTASPPARAQPTIPACINGRKVVFPAFIPLSQKEERNLLGADGPAAQAESDKNILSGLQQDAEAAGVDPRSLILDVRANVEIPSSGPADRHATLDRAKQLGASVAQVLGTQYSNIQNISPELMTGPLYVDDQDYPAAVFVFGIDPTVHCSTTTA